LSVAAVVFFRFVGIVFFAVVGFVVFALVGKRVGFGKTIIRAASSRNYFTRKS
jgi:hypothetical protein|tara:strand:- start:258 stop:416 length:159 start_codon:yes stop_codon:yes gene_type:complete